MEHSPATSRVFLLWVNDTLLGVFADEEHARLEAITLMESFGGRWRELGEQHWSLPPTRVLVEPRQVHGHAHHAT